jgi:hypothetical protein
MRCYCGHQGYHSVSFAPRTGNQKKPLAVHRLVALAFLGASDKRCINHKDGDRANNAIDNLEWVTHSENSLHALHVLKTFKPWEHIRNRPKGAAHWNARLSESQVSEIVRMRIAGHKLDDIAAKFGITRTHACSICKGRTRGLEKQPGPRTYFSPFRSKPHKRGPYKSREEHFK